MKRRGSIQQQLMLLVCGLLTVVVLVLAVVATFELERTAEETASGRLVERARGWADLFGKSVPQRIEQLAKLGDSAVIRSALADPDGPAREPAIAALRRLAGSTTLAIDLRDADDRIVLSTETAESRKSLVEPPAVDGYGPMFPDPNGPGVLYLIRSRTSSSFALPGGNVVERRRIASTAEARKALTNLFDTSAELTFGNRDDDVWTDLSARVTPPPRHVRKEAGRKATTYERAGSERFGALVAVPSTPWVVAVDLPRAAVLGPVRRFLERLAWTTLGLLVAGVGTAWLLSRRMSRPLSELTAAAGSIASGARDRLARIEGGDEIGRLAGAFNNMADLVTTTQRDLEAKIEDLRASKEVLAQSVRELEHGNERFKLAAEAVDSVIEEWDLASDRTERTGAFGELLGFPPEEVLPTRTWWNERIHPDDRKQVFQSINRTIAGGRRFAVEYRIRHRDGRFIPVWCTGIVMRDESGAPRTVISSTQDITEMKDLENRLLQSAKMESIGRLAGGVAHDFNNLLTAIQGYADLAALKESSPGALRECLDQIKGATGRAAELTRQLLTFARRQVIDPRVIDVNGAIRETEGLLRRLVGEGIALRLRLRDAPLPVRIDPTQLTSAILNMAANARDAMPSGGTLAIETSEVELDEHYAAQVTDVVPGRYVMIAVSDTGRGMDEATRARVFEPFFTTKPQGKGTGLGLASSYGTVKQAGGHIGIYGEIGRGTTFKIFLPEAVGMEPEAPRPPPKAPARGTETILLAEDEAYVRDVAVRALERHGYRVLPAGSGAEALAIATRLREPIHLLVTDVVMPSMDGRELAARLADLCPGLRVLFTSGYTGDVIIHRGILKPGVNFLPKPFTPTDLALRVREVLDAAEPVSPHESAASSF